MTHRFTINPPHPQVSPPAPPSRWGSLRPSREAGPAAKPQPAVHCRMRAERSIRQLRNSHLCMMRLAALLFCGVEYLFQNKNELVD